MDDKATIADLKKQNEYLRGQVYGSRPDRRQAIIQDLIRQGYDLDIAITAAEKLCTFIESGMPTVKQTKVNKAKTKPQSAVKGKRKYTKRSKFWKK